MIPQKGDHTYMISQVCFKPLWVILLTFEDKSRPEILSICQNTFNDSNEFKVCTLILVLCTRQVCKEAFLTCASFPTIPLATLLVHIVYVLSRDAKILDNFLELVEVSLNRW